ncbi:MAG: hypothetical protein LBD41_05110 [Clostridiales Family XIII bacterium]|nr:hypothetical protein [Clostridiales Family XIII bacterium]
MMDKEENILKVTTEAASFLTQLALGIYKINETHIYVCNTKYYNKGSFPQSYEGIFWVPLKLQGLCPKAIREIGCIAP